MKEYKLDKKEKIIVSKVKNKPQKYEGEYRDGVPIEVWKTMSFLYKSNWGLEDDK